MKQLDDKTRIKVMKVLAGASLFGQACALISAFGVYKTMKRALENQDQVLERSIELNKDANLYIKKIIEVCEPSDAQIAAINQGFDFEKWKEDLSDFA